MQLLTPSLRQRLSSLQLRSPRQGPETSQQGAHRGRRRGRSMEFSEHRAYVAGDDLRHLDWNAFARHEKLVIKEFESELERTVLLVTDLSASMSPGKRQLALQLTAALSWVALTGQDRVGLATLGPQALYHPPLRGRANWGTLMTWLQAAPDGGRAQLDQNLVSLARRLPRSSLMVVISDWLEPEAGQGLAYAHYRKHQLAALQILDGFDLDPPWLGPLLLRDLETGETRQLSVDPVSLGLYQKALEAHGQALTQECRKRGFAFHRCQAESGPDNILLRELVQQGWLQ